LGKNKKHKFDDEFEVFESDDYEYNDGFLEKKCKSKRKRQPRRKSGHNDAFLDYPNKY
jgi:hypothetical protein